MQVAAELGYFEEELAAIGQTCEVTVAASSETVDLVTADKVDAAFAQANPEEAAKIQIEGEYVSGDAATNAEIIKGLDFNPGVDAARATFSNAFSDLQKTGDLNASLDEAEFTEKAFPVLEGVPETTTYDPDTKEFTES